ncbi:hypothetical protein PBY51_019048 [Eleginops maclovinus]|uniref:Uncharacterized protein n=2 Tax=Eleginops maclovinus TaxID=56733 RepID=A0AAN7Y1Q6_ELEMC|nr:hypothetical protein PBY51_019048 [Eleginops maclovinus]
MPIRRNLSASLPPQSPQMVTKACVFEEGVFPLQCTPEPSKKTFKDLPQSSSSAMNPNMTFEIMDDDDQTASNATIIIGSGSPCRALTSTELSGASQLLRLLKDNEGNQIPDKRQQILSLQDARRAKPTYMHMTSAAQRKRKGNCSIQEDLTQDFTGPKRVKKEPPVASKPLRAHRFGGSQENRPRRVVRSVSEGNLLEPQKSKSIFYKTSQQFKRVTKRL